MTWCCSEGIKLTEMRAKRDGRFRMMSSDLYSSLAKNGYVFAPRYFEHLTTLELAAEVGVVAARPGMTSTAVDILQPREQALARRSHSFSGQFGLGSFPYHTDRSNDPMPPRFILFRCIEGSSEVRTKLLRASIFRNSIGYSKLCQTFVVERKKIPGRARLPMSIGFSVDDEFGMRWDTLCLVPTSVTSQDVVDNIIRQIEKYRPTVEVCLESFADCLIVDNWKMLHRRSAAPFGCARKIERVYLDKVFA